MVHLETECRNELYPVYTSISHHIQLSQPRLERRKWQNYFVTQSLATLFDAARMLTCGRFSAGRIWRSIICGEGRFGTYDASTNHSEGMAWIHPQVRDPETKGLLGTNTWLSKTVHTMHLIMSRDESCEIQNQALCDNEYTQLETWISQDRV